MVTQPHCKLGRILGSLELELLNSFITATGSEEILMGAEIKMDLYSQNHALHSCRFYHEMGRGHYCSNADHIQKYFGDLKLDSQATDVK